MWIRANHVVPPEDTDDQFQDGIQLRHQPGELPLAVGLADGANLTPRAGAQGGCAGVKQDGPWSNAKGQGPVA